VPDLDIPGVVRTLNAHGVRYVIIGGVAALVHNLPLPATVDIDITPSRDTKNLERLADAFDALEAGLLTAEEPGTWFPRHPVENWAQYDTLHLMTSAPSTSSSPPTAHPEASTTSTPRPTSIPSKPATPQRSSSPWPPGSNSNKHPAAPRTSNTWTASTKGPSGCPCASGVNVCSVLNQSSEF
jgi:hypothetical protein